MRMTVVKTAREGPETAGDMVEIRTTNKRTIVVKRMRVTMVTRILIGGHMVTDNQMVTVGHMVTDSQMMTDGHMVTDSQMMMTGGHMVTESQMMMTGGHMVTDVQTIAV